jgi:hypothetical protein
MDLEDKHCPDYEQKKRECFVQFCKDNGIDQEVNISIFDAFDQIFDRAYAFGKKIGNSDFSDAEEEEILTVPRKDIVELFQEVQKTISQCKGTALAVQSVGIKNVLWSFFGSKCLPDNVESSEPNVESSEPNVDSLPQNPTENCDNKSHISADCNKPAEPKFKVGDMAVVRGFKHPLLKSDGAIVTILSYHDKGDFYSCAIAPNVGIDIDAKYLEPYTEPTDFGREVNFPTKNNLAIYLKKSKNCDNRLQIAAMAMQGILSNENAIQYAINNFRLQDGSRNLYQAVAECSLAFADALIAESEK